MKITSQDFLSLSGYPIFERIKPLIGFLDVKYIRWWSTDVVTTAEIHIYHPIAKHITIGSGQRYSGRTRIAISLKDVSCFEKIYGKLVRDNSKTYIKFDNEGFNMLQLIAGDWEPPISIQDEELINSIDAILGSKVLGDGEKQALIKQRIGHSLFAKKVKERAGKTCQINPKISRNLIASHIKPWAVSERNEKVDIANGLCLSPNYDGLFEYGVISFNDDGSIIINKLSNHEMGAYGLNGSERIIVTNAQSTYLAWHRENKLRG